MLTYANGNKGAYIHVCSMQRVAYTLHACMHVVYAIPNYNKRGIAKLLGGAFRLSFTRSIMLSVSDLRFFSVVNIPVFGRKLSGLERSPSPGAPPNTWCFTIGNHLHTLFSHVTRSLARILLPQFLYILVEQKRPTDGIICAFNSTRRSMLSTVQWMKEKDNKKSDKKIIALL